MAMGEATSTACQMAAPVPHGQTAGERLRALVVEHHAFVWRSLRRLGIADGDVDDASQQVFLVAHRRLAQIAPASERAFLFQTAVRVASDWRRAQKRRGELAGIDLRDLPDARANPEEEMDERRARALLDRVLAAMPMDLRVVFVLFELEEMTMIEIATLAELPPGTVASRLRRARQLFQATVKTLASGASSEVDHD